MTSAGPTSVQGECGCGRTNSLGIGKSVLDALLDRLDADDTSRATSKRIYARWPYRRLAVDLEIQHPGGTVGMLRVASRNLSRGGASLLHCGFLHDKSKCTLHLPAIDGHVRPIPGIIARCTHRGGRVHEVGIRFDKPIDMRTFFDGRTASRRVSMERVDPASLTGEVTVCVRTEAEYSLVRSLLAETALTVRRVTADDMAQPSTVANSRALLIGQAQDGDSGTLRLAALRSRGVTTPAVMLTADVQAPPREGLWDLPDVALAVQPVSRDSLLATLAEFLLVRSQADDNGIGSLDATTASSVRIAISELRDRLSVAVASGQTSSIESLATRLSECARLGRVSELVTAADTLRSVALLGNQPEVATACFRVFSLIDTSSRGRAA